MSSIFFSGEKSSKEEAVAALMEDLPDYTDDRFWVRFESDDTSNHLTAIIESKFNATIPEFKLKKKLMLAIHNIDILLSFKKNNILY